MRQVLGIDCGGSTTRAVLVADGRPIWTGSGGPANLSSVPGDMLRESITTAIAGCPLPKAVCGAFAGLITARQRDSAESFLRAIFPEAFVTAVPDFEAALVACGTGADICVLAGTGSMVCSFGKHGDLHRSGGRGYLLGDEGSAFQYGRDALLHYLDDPQDDVSPALRTAIELAFGSARKNEIIAALYASPDAPKRLASLTEAFAADAHGGAVYCLKSLRINSGKLAHVVSKHLRKFHPEMRSVRFGCQGGLWSNSIFRDAFTEQLVFWCKVEDIEVDYDPPAPVFGAAEIAGRLLQL